MGSVTINGNNKWGPINTVRVKLKTWAYVDNYFFLHLILL